MDASDTLKDLRDIMVGKPLFEGRLLQEIAFILGIPITLFRFGDFPAIKNTFLFDPQNPPQTSEKKHFLEDMNSVIELHKYYKTHRYEIIPAGYRNEHPFVHLMRNQKV